MHLTFSRAFRKISRGCFLLGTVFPRFLCRCMVSFTHLPGRWSRVSCDRSLISFCLRLTLAALFPAISNRCVDTEPLLFDRNYGYWDGCPIELGFPLIIEVLLCPMIVFSRSFGKLPFWISRRMRAGVETNFVSPATLGNLKTEISPWKHSFFSVHTTLEEIKNATITTYLGFVREENHMITAPSSFPKSFA